MLSLKSPPARTPLAGTQLEAVIAIAHRKEAQMLVCDQEQWAGAMIEPPSEIVAGMIS
jgi:hypothetical protein